MKEEDANWEPFGLANIIDIALPHKRLVLKLSATSYALMAHLAARSARLLHMVDGDIWSLKVIVCQSSAGFAVRYNIQ